MATWKKVIVSGSTANLAALQVDNLTTGQVVIGGGGSNLTTTAINGTGNIVATTGATGLVHSGSFSGSFSGALTGTATTASYVNGNIFTGTNIASSASFAVTASFVLGGSATAQSLSNSTGITSFTFNGSSPATVSVSGASTLNTNAISKWTGTAFANSSLTDNGTTITGATSLQLTGANSSLTGSFSGSLTGIASNATSASFASNATSASYALTATSSSYALNATSASYALNATSASFAASTNNITNAIDNNTNNNILTAQGTGIINGESNLTFNGSTLALTGDATISSNLTVTGNLSVAGTASFTNTDNLNIRDKFILINSGSTSLADSGWVTQYNAAGSGSAFYLEAGTAGTTGTYGRFAMAYDVIGTSTALTVDEYVVSAKISATAPSANPTWGGSANGSGNIHINNSTGDIFIYA